MISGIKLLKVMWELLLVRKDDKSAWKSYKNYSGCDQCWHKKDPPPGKFQITDEYLVWVDDRDVGNEGRAYRVDLCNTCGESILFRAKTRYGRVL